MHSKFMLVFILFGSVLHFDVNRPPNPDRIAQNLGVLVVG